MSFTFQAYKNRLQASYFSASSDISHISAPTISIMFYCWWFTWVPEGPENAFLSTGWNWQDETFKTPSVLKISVAASLPRNGFDRSVERCLPGWVLGKVWGRFLTLNFLFLKTSFVGIFGFSELRGLLWLSGSMLTILFAPPLPPQMGICLSPTPPPPYACACFKCCTRTNTHTHA